MPDVRMYVNPELILNFKDHVQKSLEAVATHGDIYYFSHVYKYLFEL